MAFLLICDLSNRYLPLKSQRLVTPVTASCDWSGRFSKRLLTTTEQPYHIQQAASAFPSSPSIFHLDLIPLSATAAMPKIIRHYFADNQRVTPPAEDFLFFSFFAIPKPYPSPTQAQRCCLGLGRAWVWRRKACFGT